MYNFFSIFKNGHYAADQVCFYFLWVQFQKIGKFGRARWKVFTFKKSQGPLKWIFFSENLQIPSLYFKEQSPKGKFEIICFLFYSYLNKLMKKLASVPTLKNVKINLVVVHFSCCSF